MQPAEYDREILQAAHRHSLRHADEVRSSLLCGCFYCLETFPPDDVAAWLTEGASQETALCPFCGVDAVIGDRSGHPVGRPSFLRAMRAEWF